MAWKRKVTGGILAVIGFMLSPLSWWNDLFVNVPIALAFAWVISLIYRPAFEISLVLGYWLTNVLGFVLMHKGIRHLSSEEKGSVRGELRKDMLVSLIYTGILVVLMKLGVLKPITAYFGNR